MSVLSMLPMAWDIGSFFKNASHTIKAWGSSFIILIGVVMVISAVYQIAKGLITHGKGPGVNWGIAITLLILGGAFMVGGFSFVQTISSGGRKTIMDLGQTIIPMLPFVH